MSSTRSKTESTHPWIQPCVRKLADYFQDERRLRKVWKASTKLGTQPGGIGMFSASPEPGVVCEWWPVTLIRSEMSWIRPHRVLVDRVDDVVQRVFVSLV